LQLQNNIKKAVQNDQDAGNNKRITS
jgi:hypothetical protein